MEYAWYYDLVLLYVVYSFLGWVAETVVSAARGRGFVDRGFAAGPLVRLRLCRSDYGRRL